MTWSFDRVAGPFEFTEGPVWDGETVLFTDGDLIRQYDPITGETEVAYTGTNGGLGTHFGPDGALYVCESDGRRVARYADGERETVVSTYRGDRLNSPNDLEFDDRGRLWFTDPRYGDGEPEELDRRSVYRVDDPLGDDPTAVRVTEDTTQPNGLLVDSEASRLYVAQSMYGEGEDRELRAYPIEDGEVGSHEVLHDFGPHRGIDGMTFDADRNVVATAGWKKSGPGPMLYVFAPSGRVLETHPIEENPTHCTFGGPDGSDIYVTTHNGSLYRAETERIGLDAASR